jgi:rod shape-determining protein MreD
MRKVILSVLAVAIALVVQLTYLNGLHLPGGAVPDLVLVMTAALGLAGGPVTGAVTGFVAGLALDLAPPGSGIIGIYALVLCIVGWTCGRFRGTVARSAGVPMLIAAAAAAAGEIMIAALGMALQPAQVSWTSVRQVLPAAMLYDVIVSPFVLFLVLLAGAWLAGVRAGSAAPAALGAPGGSALQARQGLAMRGSRQGLAAAGGAAGGAVLPGLGGWLAGPAQSRRARRAAARRTPRLGPGAGRPGDGWIGSSAAARGLASRPLSRQALASMVSRPHGASVARLRSGVAGSAAGGQVPRSLPARPVHLRLAGSSGRKRSTGGRTGLRGGALGLGALGRGALGDGRGARRAMDRIGRRGGRGSFRPVVLPGGAARRPGGGHPTPAAPRFRVHPGGAGRGTTGLSAASGMTGAGGLGQPSLRSLRHGLGQPRRLRMNARRGDGMLGRPLTGSRLGAGRAAFSPAGLGSAGTGSGGLSSPRSTGWVARNRTARSWTPRGLSAPGLGLTARGGLAPVRPGKSRPATPRFRSRPMTAGRLQTGKRPRFSRRRWPVLGLLGRRRGGVARSWRRNGRRSAAGR